MASYLKHPYVQSSNKIITKFQKVLDIPVKMKMSPPSDWV